MGDFIIELIANILFQVIFAAIGRFIRWLWQAGKSAFQSFMLVAPELFGRKPKPQQDPPPTPSLMEPDSSQNE